MRCACVSFLPRVLALYNLKLVVVTVRYWMEMEEAAAVSPVGHRVFLAASLAAINNLAFGYDVGVVSGSLRDMATSLRLSTLEQVVVVVVGCERPRYRGTACESCSA